MELQIKRHDISFSLDFNRKGIISSRPLTEYLQYLNILPEDLKALSNKHPADRRRNVAGAKLA